jgi:hypothetical protein
MQLLCEAWLLSSCEIQCEGVVESAMSVPDAKLMSSMKSMMVSPA